MASKKPKPVPYRRKREKRTNYDKRLKLLLSKKLRLVVRISNNKVVAQIVEFQPQGDLIKISLDSNTLKKLGWKYSLNNLPAAYLTGYALAKKATVAGIKEAVLDTGLVAPLKKSKHFAFLKGVLDGGLEVPHGDESIFPSEERIQGKHIKDYAENFRDPGMIEKHYGQIMQLVNGLKD